MAADPLVVISHGLHRLEAYATNLEHTVRYATLCCDIKTRGASRNDVRRELVLRLD